jgi:phospholipase C
VTVVTPVGSLAGIKHIIFFVQENRSFDSYFGKLGTYRASRVSGASPRDVNDLDSLPAGFALYTPATGVQDPSSPIPPFHQRTLRTEDLAPNWSASHADADIANKDYLDITGQTFKMDEFLKTVVPDSWDPDGTRAMGYYDQTDFPYYYELATQFATSDAYHSSLLSSTVTNRMYLFAATSAGLCNTATTGHAPWPVKTIFESLQNNGVSWRYYYQDGVFLAQFAAWSDPVIQSHVWKISNLFTLLADPEADSKLPQVVFIEHGLSTDEHPTDDVQTGAVYVKSVIDALLASSAWKDSIFILTYDEGGGLYDHVPPFPVVEPDNIPPDGCNYPKGNFDLSGFRVPLVVLSPYAKAHYVSHTNMEHTSILKLIETRFNLPPLTARDAAAPDMTEFFDFNNPAWLTPPVLPDQKDECVTDATRCKQSLEAYPGAP